MAKEKKNVYTGTGHRKTSVARVTLTPGKGKITVNGRDVREYFPSEICARSAGAGYDKGTCSGACPGKSCCSGYGTGRGGAC